MISMNIRIGYACLNMTLRGDKTPTRISVGEPNKIPIFSNRSCIRKTIEKKGMDYLKDLCKKNVQDIPSILEWNEKHGIKFYRLSSMMLPHFTDPEVERFSMDFLKEDFKKIREVADKYGHRLTFHPGQYNVVGTPDEKTFQQTCLDLKYHADVLDLMELDQNSVIVVHGGGVYGDKAKTIQRWCSQYHRLPENVKQRLVIENCEKCFSIKDCLKIAIKVNIPVVFDTHHFACYKQLHPNETFHPPEFYIKHVLPFWKRRNIKPKCHISEQGSGRTGHHSDYVETIPNYILEIPSRYNTSIDIMIEAKMKELSIQKLYEKYPQCNCLI